MKIPDKSWVLQDSLLRKDETILVKMSTIVERDGEIRQFRITFSVGVPVHRLSFAHSGPFIVCHVPKDDCCQNEILMTKRDIL